MQSAVPRLLTLLALGQFSSVQLRVRFVRCERGFTVRFRRGRRVVQDWLSISVIAGLPRHAMTRRLPGQNMLGFTVISL